MQYVLFALLSFGVFAQDLQPEKVELTFKDGITFRAQNDLLMRLRFRIQNRFSATTQDTDSADLKSAEFSLRRMRLRFDGHALDPRLLYRVQLSFTRADQDWDNAEVPNILRDAVVGWRWNENHTFWAGLAKLPGNRQRVISSSAQQFVDRSLVNATFNIDRDIGLQHYSKFGSEKPIWLKLAVSNGEGRNQINKNASMATTARLEWYPLGSFHDDGDNFEADLYREPSPKLGLALVTSANQKSARTGGQTGKDMGEGEFRSMESRFFDLVFKYRGYSFSSEYAKRTVGSPVITNKLFVFEGEGYNLQTGYLLESNWEPSLRFSLIRPSSFIDEVTPEVRQYTAGLSRYIKNHVVKIQTDLTYNEQYAYSTTSYLGSWQWRVQFEVGI